MLLYVLDKTLIYCLDYENNVVQRFIKTPKIDVIYVQLQSEFCYSVVNAAKLIFISSFPFHHFISSYLQIRLCKTWLCNAPYSGKNISNDSVDFPLLNYHLSIFKLELITGI